MEISSRNGVDMMELAALETVLCKEFPDIYSCEPQFRRRKAHGVFLAPPPPSDPKDVARIEAFRVAQWNKRFGTKKTGTGKRSLDEPIVVKPVCENVRTPRKARMDRDPGLVGLDEQLKASKRAPNLARLLSQYLDRTGMEPPELYGKIGMSRQAYGKVANCVVKSRHQKATLFKLIVGLELGVEDATKFLKTAGYAFSHEPMDVVVKYCLENGMGNMASVDRCLAHAELPTLFSEV